MHGRVSFADGLADLAPHSTPSVCGQAASLEASARRAYNPVRSCQVTITCALVSACSRVLLACIHDSSFDFTHLIASERAGCSFCAALRCLAGGAGDAAAAGGSATAASAVAGPAAVGGLRTLRTQTRSFSGSADAVRYMPCTALTLS